MLLCQQGLNALCLAAHMCNMHLNHFMWLCSCLQDDIYCSSYSAAAYLDSIGFDRSKKVGEAVDPAAAAAAMFEMVFWRMRRNRQRHMAS
jgi:hypothetical protein